MGNFLNLDSQLCNGRRVQMPVVRISWFEGRDHEQKQKVAAEVTESIVRNRVLMPDTFM